MQQKRLQSSHEINSKIIDYLVKETSFVDLPQQLIDDEYNHRINNLQTFFKNRMNTTLEKTLEAEGEQLDEFQKVIRQEAEKTVKLLFI